MEEKIKNFYKNKKIFITGVTGFKGAYLAKILSLFGSKIYGFSLPPPTKPSLFEILNLKNNINYIVGDIRNLTRLKKVIKKIKPNIIFHLAAQPIVIDSYKNPVYTYETNVLGTVNLLEASKDIKELHSIINVTTDKVYGDRGKDFYKEDDLLDGIDPYSNSKVCSEYVTLCYKRSFFKNKNISLSTVRAGNVLGGGDFAKYRIIPDCYRALKNKKELIIRNPDSIRPYQYILDSIYGYLLLAKKQYNNKKIEGSYNFAPEKNDMIKTIELVKLFNKETGNVLKIKIKRDKNFHETKILRLSNKKAKTILNWKPKYNIYNTIKLTAIWYKFYLEKKDVNYLTEKQIKDYFNI